MQEQIIDLLNRSLQPDHLEVINESHLHAGHGHFENPNETHFRVVIATHEFEGLSTLERHRRIHESLESCFKQGLHSLSIQALSTKEWKSRP